MLSVHLHAGPGLDDYTLHLANALSQIAQVSCSLSAETLARYAGALAPQITPLVFKRPRRRQLWGLTEMEHLARQIRALKPQVVHLQNDGFWESFLLAGLGSLPLVNTVHDPLKHSDQRTLVNRVSQALAIRRACGWVVHSENLRKILVERFRVDPAWVLVHPHGVLDYYTRFSPAAVQREPFILFFGELRWNKGCDLLLRAFETLDLPGWRLVVAGKGSGLEAEAVRVARLGSRLDFRWRFIPDPEVADLFSRAGLVALPYRHGSQSGVLALAAAFGAPVLATRVGSLPELLPDRQQVLWVEPENESALRQGLSLLVFDQALRSQLGQNLQNLALTEWSWAAIAQLTLRFYENRLR